MSSALIFGGTGFIGSHFAEYLIANKVVDAVILADIKPLGDRHISEFFRRAIDSGKVRYHECDVRNKIQFEVLAEDVTLIANFAAVHREPGHEAVEYYETNLLGAENVCLWAESVSCDRIIFTSSIAPYGPTEEEKTEDSIPVPVSAYGGSKLAAEKIHIAWQKTVSSQRQLVIVRPGVVFGPGEGGNVSRLIKAVLKRYFFYMGNRNTRKAGTYVKELCAAVYWVLEQQKEKNENFTLFNMSMDPGPSIAEYVEAVCQVAGKQVWIPSVPYSLLLGVAYTIDFFARPLGIKHPFSPVRIRKLVRSNNIKPSYLVENGYSYRYTLKSALADWKNDCPEEW